MIFLAIRHLTARKRQSILTLLAIVFGSAAFVTITAFFAGFQRFIIDQLVNNDAHIRVYAREEYVSEHGIDRQMLGFGAGEALVRWVSAPSGRKDDQKIENPRSWTHRLTVDPRVDSFSPQITAQVILSRAGVTATARLVGCDAASQVRVTTIGDSMVQGKFEDLQMGGNRIVLGIELLQKLGAHVGETIQVSNGRMAPRPFKVTGVFKAGLKALDEGTAYGLIEDVQRLNGTPQLVNEIAIRLKNFEQAPQVADDWSALSREKVQSWDRINANFLNVFKIQNGLRFLVIAVILLVAGFGIYNILNVSVSQKRKDIAILRSMGFEANDIGQLFLLQGVILGITGGLIGLGIGFGASSLLSTVKFTGGPLGNMAGNLKISFDPLIYVKALVLSTVASSIASFLPARAASRLAPIEIIRAGAE